MKWLILLKINFKIPYWGDKKIRNLSQIYSDIHKSSSNRPHSELKGRIPRPGCQRETNFTMQHISILSNGVPSQCVRKRPPYSNLHGDKAATEFSKREVGKTMTQWLSSWKPGPQMRRFGWGERRANSEYELVLWTWWTRLFCWVRRTRELHCCCCCYGKTKIIGMIMVVM